MARVASGMRPVEVTVHPHHCDAFGHVNQATFLTLFEQARWSVLERGPGMDVFAREQVIPAVRRVEIEYLEAAWPGDVLVFTLQLTHRGRTSFRMTQEARSRSAGRLVARAEFVFVCVGQDGRPTPIPPSVTHRMRDAGLLLPGERHTVNGVSLAVELRGSASGPVVLFLHGFPLNRSLWGPVADLPPGWRSVVPDLRGFGDSDAPDVGYSMAIYARDMVALLDRLEIRRVVLCGLSLGGYVAFEILRQARDRVHGLVLMNTRATADSPDDCQRRDRLAAEVRERGMGAAVEALLPSLLGPRSRNLPAMEEAIRGMIEQTPLAGFLGGLLAVRDRPDSTGMLASLRDLPTLVIGGADDPITPPAVIEDLAGAIPGASCRIVAKAGHLTPVENPVETGAALREFLAGVS